MTMRRTRGGLLAVLVMLLVLAVSGVVAADEVKDLKKDFIAARKAGNVGEAIRIVGRLANVGTADAVETIIQVTFYDPDPRVFESAVSALAGMRATEALDYMVKTATKNGKIEVRVGLTEVLAKIPGEKTEAALVELLSDRDSRILSPAARALAERRSKKAVPALIAVLKEEEKEKDYIWGELRQALTDITGEDFQTAKDWDDWWSVAKGTFDPKTNRGGKDTATIILDEPDFFTEKIASKKIVFILDISGSMHLRDPAKGGEATSAGDSDDGVGECSVCGYTHRGVKLPDHRERIFRVKREMGKVVKGISPSVQFNVICFSDKLLPWNRGGLIKASKGAKMNAMEFVAKFKAMGLTHTDEALELAFQDKKANTIFLLSDGMPLRAVGNNPQPIPIPEILDKVRVLNRFRKVKIYTFGFAAMADDPQEKEALEFMKKLAAENRGKFTAIP